MPAGDSKRGCRGRGGDCSKPASSRHGVRGISRRLSACCIGAVTLSCLRADAVAIRSSACLSELMVSKLLWPNPAFNRTRRETLSSAAPGRWRRAGLAPDFALWVSGFPSQMETLLMANATQRARAAARTRQNGRCYYCGFPMWLRDVSEFSARFRLTTRQATLLQCTAEHLQARCKGGSDAPSNIVAACFTCNHRRHARPSPDSLFCYRALVAERTAKGVWHAFTVRCRLA